MEQRESRQRPKGLKYKKHKENPTSFKPLDPRLIGKHNPGWTGGKIGYYGPDWHYKREEVLERDNHTCHICGQPGNVVHHIIPFKVCRKNEPNNLMTVCVHCHNKIEGGAEET